MIITRVHIQGADNSQFPSILDVIHADDPMVYNTLIDQVILLFIFLTFYIYYFI